MNGKYTLDRAYIVCLLHGMECITLQQATASFSRLHKALLQPHDKLCFSQLGMWTGRHFFDQLRYATPVSRRLHGVNAWSLAALLESPSKRAHLEAYLERTGRRVCPANIRVAITLRFGKANQFPPFLAGQLLQRAGAKHVLDPCAGWGDRLVGAAAAGVQSYWGIDSNTDLEPAYGQLPAELSKHCATQVHMAFAPAESVDFLQRQYDTVLTCPPYYRKELYAHMPLHSSMQAYMQDFLVPVFQRAFQGLQPRGTLMLILPKQIGDALFAELQLDYKCEPLPAAGTKSMYNKSAGTECIYTANKL